MRVALGLAIIIVTVFGGASDEFDRARDDNPSYFERDRNVGSKSVSFFQLDSGAFRAEPPSPISDEDKRKLYDGKFFANGKPVFVFKTPTEKRPANQLHQAFADYGGFHARVERSNNVITIPHEDSSIMNHLSRIQETSRKFGVNAALVSNGSPASPLAAPRKIGHEDGKVPEGPPDWDAIHRSDQVSRDLPYNELKRMLNDKRYLVFKNPDGSQSLAVRALSDGRIERQLMNSLGGARFII